jgi:hypothetical protein
VKVPATTAPKSDLATVGTKISVSEVDGLQYLRVELGGRFTLAGMARRLGFTWPLPEDLFVVQNPKVEYDVLAPSLGIDMTVDIPAAKILDTEATLFLSSNEVSLQVSLYPPGPSVGRKLHTVWRRGLYGKDTTKTPVP